MYRSQYRLLQDSDNNFHSGKQSDRLEPHHYRRGKECIDSYWWVVYSPAPQLKPAGTYAEWIRHRQLNWGIYQPSPPYPSCGYRLPYRESCGQHLAFLPAPDSFLEADHPTGIDVKTANPGSRGHLRKVLLHHGLLPILYIWVYRYYP